MTHRAEQIMQAVETVITGLTTTGTRVVRAKVRTIETAPALSLEQGGDAVNPETSTWPLVRRDLSIKIFAHVNTNTDPETQLNLIREEVYTAIMADITQGLSYVFDTIPVDDDEPEFTGEANKITGRQQMNFIIRYEHSWDNAGA